MLSILQPTRPRHPPQPHPSPASRQQIRTTYTQVSGTSLSRTDPTMKPRSQVEEMPPFVLPSHTLSPLQSCPAFGHIPKTIIQQDSSTRHPVFFTDSFRRPPFPLPPDASRGQSPIAHGYIYEPKRPVQAGNGQTKL